MTLSTQQVHNEKWTLFLDRDGVINRRIPGGYVQHPSEFEFLEGSLFSIKLFSKIFHRIIIVTNQQGIGKGIMSVDQLHDVHYNMINIIEDAGGKIDNSYFCPSLASNKSNCRKPASNMAIWAQNDFPDINFEKSIMVGDMPSDIEFGNLLNMTTVHVNGDSKIDCEDANFNYFNLDEIAKDLIKGKLT